jgi:hypothetical protein
MIRAQVDWENNSEAFWDAFHKRFPDMQSQDTYQFTEEEWEEVVNLPGWDDPSSPDYAPHPLILE